MRPLPPHTKPLAPAQRWRDRSLALVMSGLALGGVGCALFGSDPPVPESDRQTRAERIEELQRAIDDEHTSLEALITDPSRPQDIGLRHDPEIEALAQRLDAHQRELAELETLQRQTAP